MKFEVKANPESIIPVWEVIETTSHREGWADTVWASYPSEGEATEAASQFQAEDNAKEYIGNVLFNQLIAPAGNGSLALLSQEDVRELIRQVVDEGDY